ncbi:MAG: Ig domain-containing protein [Syntrophorhabdaceae bacterium]|nr:Ig domain-containing protein [Syntrophorhabdaceae bacterium]
MNGQGFPFCTSIEAMMARRFIVFIAVLFFMAACSKKDDAVPVNLPKPKASPVVKTTAKEASEKEDEEIDVPEESVSVGIRQVWFVGGDASAGNTLGVEYEAFSKTGNPVQVDIKWSKNGESAGEGKFVQSELQRGDKIVVTLTPSAGKIVGRPVTLNREITNSPPLIEGHGQFQFEDNVASFQLRATDADGDTLTYSLKDAPAGMTINQSTGRIQWTVPPETTGKVMFMVEVSDGNGGISTAPLSITIAPQPESEEKQPEPETPK